MPYNQLADLIAKRFIARRDVKATQTSTGYIVDEYEDENHEKHRRPWTRPDLLAHLTGQKSYGHYLLNTDDQCKLFSFDIDLEKPNPATGYTGWLPTIQLVDDPTEAEYQDWVNSFKPADPRNAWHDRKHPGRKHMKLQFRLMANMLMSVIYKDLEIPCLAAYSGNKGIHVYALTGPISGYEAREGAQIVLDTIGDFEPIRGNNFFRHKNTDPVDGFPNLSIEVFPKQESLAGKDLGNLMRIPLGRNLKSPKDPTFFIDMTSPLSEMRPQDPVYALTEGLSNPWKVPGE